MPDVVTVTENAGARYTWASGSFTWSSASAGKNWESAYPAVYAFAVAVSLSMLESVSRQFNKPVGEAFGVIESTTRQVTLQKYETLLFAETYADLIAYVLRFVESFSLAENLLKDNQKRFNETWSLLDYLSKRTSKEFISAVRLEDALYRQTTVNQSEILSISDSHRKSIMQSHHDALEFSEALKRGLVKAYSEAFALAETYADLIAYILRISENLNVIEQPSKKLNKPLPENFGLADAKGFGTVKRVVEAIALADAWGRTVAYRRYLNEGLSITDALRRALKIKSVEALSLAEQYRRHANGVVSDMIVSSTLITEEDFASIVQNGHPPGYTNFRDFIQGDYTYQRALFRAILKSNNADRGYIDALRLTIDVPDIFDRGVAEITNSAAGITVQFSRSFRFTPQVTMTHKGGTTTAIPRILGTPTTTSFTAVLEDKSGARVTGSFSWLAQGC